MTEQDTTIADRIAEIILNKFDTLPTKYKPRSLPDGRREWVPLAGVVVVKMNKSKVIESLQCVAIATGMKCLARDKIPQARGYVLHDWHAEILALRGFNRWILDECQALTVGMESLWLQCVNSSYPFELRPDTQIHMYVSAAPCGDASMELIMASQPDATPWKQPPPSARPGDMIGRAHFDQLGIVRRKPSRPDAPSTWSKSCSDKLTMKQCTSLLSSFTSKLVDPSNVYLKSLILPESQIVNSAVDRAFTGRMAPLLGATWSSYSFKPFDVVHTKHEFVFRQAKGATSSNLATLWTPHRQEALVNGVLMGRRQFDPRGASCVSRRSLWHSVVTIAAVAGLELAKTYEDAKRNKDRTAVKEDVIRLALQGWRSNDGDDDWKLDSV